jgi:CheY-like chemotaxis protein
VTAATDASATGTGLRVLVVEDSDDQRILLGRQFSRAGCTVELASSGDRALALLDGFKPEIIVIDLIMPGTDGWELTTRMRDLVPEAAVVISSVLDAHDYPAADAVLPKPFTGDQVRRLVQRLSEEHTDGD